MRITIEFDLPEMTIDALRWWWVESGRPEKNFTVQTAAEEVLAQELMEIEEAFNLDDWNEANEHEERA